MFFSIGSLSFFFGSYRFWFLQLFYWTFQFFDVSCANRSNYLSNIQRVCSRGRPPHCDDGEASLVGPPVQDSCYWPRDRVSACIQGSLQGTVQFSGGCCFSGATRNGWVSSFCVEQNLRQIIIFHFFCVGRPKYIQGVSCSSHMEGTYLKYCRQISLTGFQYLFLSGSKTKLQSFYLSLKINAKVLPRLPR